MCFHHHVHRTSDTAVLEENRIQLHSGLLVPGVGKELDLIYQVLKFGTQSLIQSVASSEPFRSPNKVNLFHHIVVWFLKIREH